MDKNKIMRMMPTVLFTAGIVGVFVSEVMCVRDTLKAEKVLEKKPIRLAYDEKATPVSNNATEVIMVFDKPTYYKEIIKATWKCYIPTLVSTTATITFLVASRKLTQRQIAVLSSAVVSSGALVGRYRNEIRKISGEEVLHKVDRVVAAEEITKAKPPVISTSGLLSCENFDLSEDGEYIFFDPLTKMKFRSTKLAVLGAKYYLNRNLNIGLSAPLSMFYGFLGLELPYEYSSFGWDLDQMAEGGYMWADIDVVRSDGPDPETGEWYYILEYDFPSMTDDIDGSYFPYGNPLSQERSFAS